MGTVFTACGRSIQALGIKPDIVVEDPTDTLTRVREADLTRHLLNGTKPEDGKDKEPAVQRTKPTAQPGDAKPAELGSKDDFQLQQAIAHLKGEPVKAVSPTVAATKPAATPTN